MIRKLVSVIIPNFNGLPFLNETIRSVQKQSYEKLEVIIVDDNSTDDSLDFLNSIDDNRFSVYKNLGKGACAARNYGLELASGEYIQFLDADDLLSTDKIEKQVDLLKKYPNRVAVCSTMHFYDNPENGKIVDRDFMFSTNQPEDFLLKLYGGNGEHHNMVQTNAWLTPKSILNKVGKWDESLSKDQDGEYFCRVVLASEGVCYSAEALNYYRKHVGGSNIANQKQRKNIESQLKALNAKANHLKKFADSQVYKNAFALQYKLLAINAYPKFKDVYKIANQQSKTHGGSKHLPALGGRIIESIKQVFGWRLAKQVSYWIHKVI
ncbi:glycosyltransferase family 2 protein [Flavobacteriaceae bacterium 14752]|uniref:glycosyltransferase family 2 protein n=1 Tax=Mesohalobacter salilacus TaxID=2491711 RepID=UPI000F632137|nr:glycosyltransferase [Flavobacteriaceae bacterium 14752]